MAIVIYMAIHSAIFLADKTLELAELQRMERLTDKLFSMPFKELAQLDVSTLKDY